ncbi:bifunctional sugar phosphate isomerase/epimerase/4-hydroxyphenylpyruvate dioxygenase family protein [Muricoccus radiodurans]|uniref:bifunctional sugar phosphate isomerase/epimerase/4-hydroxyphenylpyruvate dioxygenase family protein n=1 Tax=Muricoccus radiodurans TaxID=2231721 RepID=UPI003CED3A14
MNPLPKSVATVCLSGSLPDKIEAAASAGFQGVEIFEQDLLTYDGTPAAIRAMAEDLNLAITIFQPFRDFEAMPEPQRRRNLDRAERKFDVMEELGTDLVLVCSNVQPAAIDDPARAAADLREMAERAARRGLRVGYEALAWGRHVNRWRQAWEIVRMADHPALGLILDSFHTLSLGDDLSGLSRAVPAEKIAFVQLADAPRLSMDVLSWSRHHRVFPGQGDLPVGDFLKEVLAAGYRGPLSLEVFNDEFRAAPSRRTARDAHRSLIWLDSTLAGPPSVPAAPLPSVPRLDGVEFIEFAVDDARRRELSTFLGTLGFGLAGRHRSKDVELWRQGGVNLVLNAEPDSAAAAHFEMHGASVCATALRVDDSARAMTRAEALLCSTWRERVGEGERRIPAVRAPDGTLLYLVEPGSAGRSIWESDFELLPGAADTRGFEGVDHIAQALAPGQMDGFVLFHRAVFGLEPQPLVDLPDPQGLVQSRAMSDPAGRVRLPLNVSESRQTATGRFVSAIAGAGVHHVAFAARDIRAAVERPASWLTIPDNYYEDIGARFGLEDDAIAALERDNLLFDRDAAGNEFLHAYTLTFEDRFFFEVVERRGGYRDYGAANAAIRMAAQARSRPWMPPR